MGCFVVDETAADWFAGPNHAPQKQRCVRSRKAAEAKTKPKIGVGHERPGTAAGNLRLLPPHRARRIDVRPPRRQRRQAHQPAAQRRPHHHRDARPHPRLHDREPHGPRRAPTIIERPRERWTRARCTPPAPHRRARQAGRSAAQLPLLRQPAEISAVRQHLQREVGGGEPRRARARQHPSAPAGGARVRRRRRRRHACWRA